MLWLESIHVQFHSVRKYGDQLIHMYLILQGLIKSYLDLLFFESFIFYYNSYRHEVKRNPLGSTAFGIGPRNCAGMKFALIEMKLALVRLVLSFEFKRSASTPDKLTTFEGQLVRPQDFSIVLKKREQNFIE